MLGTSFVARFVDNLANMPAGTVIVINTETGEYMSAASEDAAFDAFERKYGWGVPAFKHIIGDDDVDAARASSARLG